MLLRLDVVLANEMIDGKNVASVHGRVGGVYDTVDSLLAWCEKSKVREVSTTVTIPAIEDSQVYLSSP